MLESSWGALRKQKSKLTNAWTVNQTNSSVNFWGLRPRWSWYHDFIVHSVVTPLTRARAGGRRPRYVLFKYNNPEGKKPDVSV